MELFLAGMAAGALLAMGFSKLEIVKLKEFLKKLKEEMMKK